MVWVWRSLLRCMSPFLCRVAGSKQCISGIITRRLREAPLIGRSAGLTGARVRPHVGPTDLRGGIGRQQSGRALLLARISVRRADR